jgi:small-conductance mechanosensitive channel
VLALAAFAWWRTTPGVGAARPRGAAAALIDTSALDTARRLVPLATTADEQVLAGQAVAAADHVLDQAFAQALRDAAEHPPEPTPEIRAAQARLEAAARQLVEDNARVAGLRELAGKSSGPKGDEVAADLALAEAEFEVHQYEFASAGRALAAVGGDLRARIESLVAAHRAAGQRQAPAPQAIAWPDGLIRLVGRWLDIRRKDRALQAAIAQSEAAQAALRASARTLSEHPSAAAGDGSAASRLERTRRLVADRETLAAFDERIGAERELAQVYEQWRAVAARQFGFVEHRVWAAVASIAAVCLALLLAGSWVAGALGRLRLDRRQTEALRTMVMVALQVVAAVYVVFVLIGPPSQLSTFLGLAGAGLTVALKDFIVAFAGWFVLMGRNGIRLGDWVEIRGVAGEVVELGMFHTVLLETGNWTDSGHPTGRRVTFTNSYAIEGHYFNFSTTGQWLWDELQVVVPTGADLYAFVGAISEKVRAATADSARQAEEEWRRAAPTRTLTGLSAEPAIRVKPVVGGTEIALRYITRADHRYQLRSSLYAAAVELLGGGTPVAPAPAA